MDYFTQLRNLEEQIIRLNTVESTLRILSSSEANKNDLMNVIWDLNDKVEDINQKIGEEFYDLFEQIRTESKSNQTQNDMNVSDELTYVVNSWVRPEDC